MKKTIMTIVALMLTVCGAQAQSQAWIEHVDKFVQDDTALDFYGSGLALFDYTDEQEAAAKKVTANDVVGEWWFYTECWEFKADGTFAHHELMQSEDKAVRVLTTPGTWSVANGVVTLQTDMPNYTAKILYAERISNAENRKASEDGIKSTQSYHRGFDNQKAELTVMRLDDSIVMYGPDAQYDDDGNLIGEEPYVDVITALKPAVAQQKVAEAGK